MRREKYRFGYPKGIKATFNCVLIILIMILSRSQPRPRRKIAAIKRREASSSGKRATLASLARGSNTMTGESGRPCKRGKRVQTHSDKAYISALFFFAEWFFVGSGLLYPSATHFPFATVLFCIKCHLTLINPLFSLQGAAMDLCGRV